MSQRLTIAAAVATLAASLSLYPLVSGWLWFWEGAGAIAVAALAGALTRLRVLPWVLCAVIGLAAQVLYLNVLLSSAHSAGRLIPTDASLHHLWRLAQPGLDGTARFAPPAPAAPGILLLTAAGIGVVAVATDLLAVRLHRPAVAGLPLLVLFCVPLTASVHQSVFGAMTVFGLGMAGYLAMLAVDGRERLRLWGRLVTVWHRGQDPAVAQRGGPNTKELAAAGRRIGVAAVVIALFVPLMVPGLRDHKLFSGGGGGGRELVALPNPLVQMNSQLHQKVPVHVLTYQTRDPSPQYLQVYVLSNLTANTWTLAPAAGEPVKDGKLPVTPGLSRTTHTSTQTTRITLAKGLTTGPRLASFLPLPYPARSVSVAGDWRSDPRSLTMFSAQSLSGLSYTAVSREVSPTPQQLQLSGEIPDSISTNYLSVPKVFLRAEQARRADHPWAGHVLRRGGGPAALVHRERQVHLQPERAPAGHGQGADQLPDQGPAGLLPAVRLRHGRAGPVARYPLPGRRGVYGRLADRARPVGRADQRRPRVAGAVLPGSGLAALRAHPLRIRWPGHRAPAGLHAAADDRRAGRDPERGHPDAHGHPRRASSRETPGHWPS